MVLYGDDWALNHLFVLALIHSVLFVKPATHTHTRTHTHTPSFKIKWFVRLSSFIHKTITCTEVFKPFYYISIKNSYFCGFMFSVSVWTCWCVTVFHRPPRTRHTGSSQRWTVPGSRCCRKDRSLPVCPARRQSNSRWALCRPSRPWERDVTSVILRNLRSVTTSVVFFLTCWWRRRWQGRRGRGSRWRRSGWTGLAGSCAVGCRDGVKGQSMFTLHHFSRNHPTCSF